MQSNRGVSSYSMRQFRKFISRYRYSLAFILVAILFDIFVTKRLKAEYSYPDYKRIEADVLPTTISVLAVFWIMLVVYAAADTKRLAETLRVGRNGLLVLVPLFFLISNFIPGLFYSLNLITINTSTNNPGLVSMFEPNKVTIVQDFHGNDHITFENPWPLLDRIAPGHGDTISYTIKTGLLGAKRYTDFQMTGKAGATYK